MSLATRLIARIDLKPTLGAVKGVRFDGLKRIGPAAELAVDYEDQGADEILLLDVTASLYGQPPAWDVIREVAHVLTIPLTYGGGVRSAQDALRVLRTGADKVAVNTAALERPELVRDLAPRLGSQALVVSLEAKSAGPGGWRCHTHGGREPSHRTATGWALEAVRDGAGEVLVTSVDRDGTGQGYDLDLVRALRARVPDVVLTASGGAGSPEHVTAVLAAGADAAAVGSLLHRGTTIAEVKAAMAANGVCVR